jgi:hypothetical protein
MTDATGAYHDRQYNARAMISDHAQIFERWKTRSQQARAHLPCRLDIPYRTSAAEKLDIFPAAGRSEALHMAVGGDESDEFKRQNALIARTWRYAFAGDIPMPGRNHLTVVEELANPDSALFKGAMGMMNR